MSEWYEAKDDYIDLDFKEKDVDIFVTQNNLGSVYITLTFDQIEDIYKKIKAK